MWRGVLRGERRRRWLSVLMGVVENRSSLASTMLVTLLRGDLNWKRGLCGDLVGVDGIARTVVVATSSALISLPSSSDRKTKSYVLFASSAKGEGADVR